MSDLGERTELLRSREKTSFRSGLKSVEDEGGVFVPEAEEEEEEEEDEGGVFVPYNISDMKVYWT